MIGISNLISGVIGATLAGASVAVWMLAREGVVVSGAVKAERMEQVSLCNDRVRRVGDTINDAVAEGVRVALEAARREEPTPEVQADIVALCKRSASCVEKGEIP